MSLLTEPRVSRIAQVQVMLDLGVGVGRLHYRTESVSEGVIGGMFPVEDHWQQVPRKKQRGAELMMFQFILPKSIKPISHSTSWGS